MDKTRSAAKMPAIAVSNAMSIYLSLAVIAIGILLRVAWIAMGDGSAGGNEAENVAIAIAKGAGFSDPYFVGSGPTAHLSPTSPLIAGIVFRLFGTKTLLSNAILVVVSLFELLASYFFLFKLSNALQFQRAAYLVAIGLLSLVPIYAFLETFYFRYWDGGITQVIVLATLWRIVLVAKYSSDRNKLLYAAMLAGVAIFISVPFGTALLGSLLVTLVVRSKIKAAVLAFVLAILAFAVVATPWTIRNVITLNKIIMTRDNAPLELAIANGDELADAHDPAAAFETRIRTIHPTFDGPGRRAFMKRGEVMFMDELKSSTANWIMSNPKKFIHLSLLHGKQIFWSGGVNQSLNRRVQAIFFLVFSVFGMITSVILSLRLRSACFPVTIFLVLAIALYLPFQPTYRYTYPIYGLLVLLSCQGLITAMMQMRAARLKAHARRPWEPYEQC